MSRTVLNSAVLLLILLARTVNLSVDRAWADDGTAKPSFGDSAQGKVLYEASCVVCHGPHAAGGIGPRLAGNPVLLNDQAFWKVVHEGRHMMPPLTGVVTEQQMADIRAWLKTLQ